MMYTTLLVAATAFAGFASAQNGTANPNLPAGVQNCCTLDPGSINDANKTTWCQAQRNTCPEICGGIGNLASGGQTCDETTLEYTCECRNGTVPDMAEYQQSVPGQMCRLWFDRCIAETNQNLEQQFECRRQRDAECGNRTTDAGESRASSTSATSSPTGTGSDEQPSNTASGSASSSSPTGGAAAIAIARDYGTPLLAGGIAAIFGLAL